MPAAKTKKSVPVEKERDFARNERRSRSRLVRYDQTLTKELHEIVVQLADSRGMDLRAFVEKALRSSREIQKYRKANDITLPARPRRGKQPKKQKA